MLRWRLLSAGVILTLLGVLLVLDYRQPLADIAGAWLLPAGFLLAWLAAGELHGFLPRDERPPAVLLASCVLLVMAATCVPAFWPLSGRPYPADCPIGRLGWPLFGVAAGVLTAFVYQIVTYAADKNAVRCLAHAVLSIVYVGLGMSFIILLRFFGSSEWGFVALLSTIAVVKAADTGAYFTGRLLGRTKLCPRLSPGKTVEGAVGGAIAAALAAIAVGLWVVPALVPAAGPGAWMAWTAYGLVLFVAGLLGDLAESMFKREARQKDSSSWLPGLGGVLDVLDSLLFAAPAAYAFWAGGWLGP